MQAEQPSLFCQAAPQELSAVSLYSSGMAATEAVIFCRGCGG